MSASKSTTSAFLPGSSEPISSSIPSAFAPLMVAISSAVSAPITPGSKRMSLNSSAARYMARTMSMKLAQSPASVPSATFTPAFSISGNFPPLESP